MKRRPHLPPMPRGSAALRLTAAAAEGVFRLPVCDGCGGVQYPPMEFCRACLDDRLHWQEVPAAGEVIATTRLHRSTSRYFEGRIPIRIGSVSLDAGAVVVAFLAAGAERVGARVRLVNRLDDAGQAVLIALGAEQDTTEVRMPAGTANTEIKGKTVLITGAAGGIGQAFIAAFREAGAGRIYAAARDPSSLKADETVHPLALDITEQAAANALPAAEIEILVNNAGRNFNEGLLAADEIRFAEEEIAVNYLGTLRLIRAVAPHMKRRSAGLIVNLATVLAHVNLPLMGSYCASKAALLSLTQGIRAELMPWGVRVVGVFPGAVDTAMSADFPPPKMSPAAVARATIDAIREGVEDCYPGEMAQELRRKMLQDPKAVERELSGLLPESK